MKNKLTQAFPDIQFKTQEKGTILAESGAPLAIEPLVRFFSYYEVEVFEATRKRPSLEDVFIDITGIEAGAMHKEKEKGEKKR